MTTRVQRVRGEKLAAGVVFVGAGSKWANPFAAKIRGGERGLATMTRQYLADDYRRWLLTECWVDPRNGTVRAVGGIEHLLGVPFAGRPTVDEIRERLGGRVLACECPLGQPCHADVLIELAAETTSHSFC